MVLYSASHIRQSAYKLFLLTFLYMSTTDSIVSAEEVLACGLDNPEWSNTTPTVDRGHIFCGNINSKGRATGYHHREGGVDSNTAKIKYLTDINTDTGVYVAETVSVWNGERWVVKRNKSSFFPDTCSRPQVLRSIAYAAQNIQCRYSNGKWSGMSAPPLDRGEYCRGNNDEPLVLNGYWRTPKAVKVATAWPLLSGSNTKKCKKP